MQVYFNKLARELRFNPSVHRAKGDGLVRRALPVGDNAKILPSCPWCLKQHAAVLKFCHFYTMQMYLKSVVNPLRLLQFQMLLRRQETQ